MGVPQGNGDRRAVVAERLALGALGAWLCLWWYLGHHSWSLGPHRWDDFRYASRALEGAFDPGLRNRYAHVWGLRLFYALFDDRFYAARAYAIAAGLGLTALAYALGRRVGGLACGLLAALLMPLFPPLLRIFSAPMVDAPAALYAALALWTALVAADAARPTPPASVASVPPPDASAPPPTDTSKSLVHRWGGALGWPLLSGVLCFVAAKSKETGAAVVPAVLWLLLQSGRPAQRTLLGWLAGVVLGQLGLCVLDAAIVGNPWVSLRPGHYENYAKILVTEPHPYRSGGRTLMRHGWMELLSVPELRGFSLCAVLGWSLGIRRQRTLMALGAWALAALLFSAWVSYRYSGIDARPRYLVTLGLPICVASASLLVRLGRNVHAGRPADPRPPAVSEAALAWLLAAVVGWVSLRGLLSGLRQLLELPLGYADARAAYFLLPLAVPLSLSLAFGLWARPLYPARLARLLRPAWLGVVVLALTASAVPPARAYVHKWRGRMAGWHRLATYVEHHDVAGIARFQVTGGQLDPALVDWRMRALTHRSAFTQRVVRHPGALGAQELLVTRPAYREQARAAGLLECAELRLGDHGHFLVFDRRERAAPGR